MNILLIAGFAVLIIGVYYSGTHMGFRMGHYEALKDYMAVMVELKQRVSEGTWEEIQAAYKVMHERKERLDKRKKA